jgi:glycosyltransferase involved in cell wall biosynthesis
VQFGNAPPDVVHLHWIAKWVDWRSFFLSIPKHIPIVLTLHDLSFVSGGCHQSDGCQRFEMHCGRCPKLRSSYAHDRSWRQLRVKQQSFAARKVHVVPNSSWTASHCAKATVLRNAQFESVIYPGVDISQFRPLDRRLSRDALRIPADRFVIAFGCATVSDPNKGLPLLLQALGRLPRRDSLLLLVFGAGSVQLPYSDLELKQIGSVASPDLLSVVYSAADVFVQPSLMETLGQTAVEAMACGTPVVAFRTGGLVDVVESGRTGFLVDLGAEEQLAACIQRIREQPEFGRTMGVSARQRAAAVFEIGAAAASYERVYQEALRRVDSRDAIPQ